MDNEENRFMGYSIKRWVLSAVGLFLIIFLAAKTWEIVEVLRKPDITAPSISITGEGRVFVKPDIGEINFAVVVEKKTVKEAQDEATALSNRIYAAVKEKGVEEKDIKTTNYSITPKYNYFYNMPMSDGSQRAPEIIGYTVSQNFQVKIRNLERAGEILAAGTSAGANQVGGLSFTTEDPETSQLEARNKAIEDAARKAKELTDKLGVRLGRVIGFGEYGGPVSPYPYYREGMGGASDATPPSLPPGENEVVVNVTVTYQIK
ncbi:SIMPL domain-containing protein [Candidatus Giovannonibacteria bacterium]|nr:SIMPL domain-containing protein [Candidatus Giovannonibacteria bacterium]